MRAQSSRPNTLSDGTVAPTCSHAASQAAESLRGAAAALVPNASLAARIAGQAVSGARRLPHGAATLLQLQTLRGLAIEALWSSAHLALYPWGAFRERRSDDEPYDLDHLAPHQRGLILGDIEAAGTPILMVHGMIDNRAIFTVLRRRLRARGFGRLFTVNYSPITNDVRSAARDLSAAIEELVAYTGYERIHVIGHSMGGLIARYYVQRLGGDERIHTLVTLGTPHAGSVWALGLPVQIGHQLRPGSDLFRELSEPSPGCRTRFVSYWSDLDQMVVPHTNGQLLHPDLKVRNVMVRNVGHMSLPIHDPVARELGAMFSQLGTDGQTLAEGVTPLRA